MAAPKKTVGKKTGIHTITDAVVDKIAKKRKAKDPIEEDDEEWIAPSRDDYDSDDEFLLADGPLVIDEEEEGVVRAAEADLEAEIIEDEAGEGVQEVEIVGADGNVVIKRVVGGPSDKTWREKVVDKNDERNIARDAARKLEKTKFERMLERVVRYLYPYL